MSDDFMTKYLAEQTERKAKAKEFLLTALKATKYKFLVVTFDGSGDSGQTESAFVSNDDSALDTRFEGDVEGEVLPESLTAARYDEEGTIEDAAWALTPDGFENNEGGFGAVIVIAEEGKVKVNYSYRVEDSVQDDYEA